MHKYQNGLMYCVNLDVSCNSMATVQTLNFTALNEQFWNYFEQQPTRLLMATAENNFIKKSHPTLHTFAFGCQRFVFRCQKSILFCYFAA